MIDLNGKRLLVLGGTLSTLDVVIEAQKMGVYVIAVDDRETGVSKEIADESLLMSTTDIEGLSKLVIEKRIDGVFCGPSDFNIINAMNLCKRSGLPFYTNEEQWDTCTNKTKFKEICKKFNIPTIPGYHITEELLQEDLRLIKYPVIVKPSDGGGSRGISVCMNEDDLLTSIPLAIKHSKSGEFFVEKFISNDHGFGCRYIANDGEIYLTGANDRYTVDLSGGKAMISGVAIFPSKKLDYFIQNTNDRMIEMFKSINIKNGSFYLQGLVDTDGKIYFHDMGLRLSGGLVYKMFETTCGFNDLKMMIKYSLGEKFANKEEIDRINPYFNGFNTGSLSVPLREGTVSKVQGIDEIRNDPSVVDVLQYYHVGDEVESEKIGNLGQLLCRIKLVTKSKKEFIDKLSWIQDRLKILDEEGNDMIYRYLDIDRLN